MEGIILYGSRYGSTRRYGEELSRETGIPAVSYTQAPPLQDKKVIVYLGGLYAGGVLGLKKTLGSTAPGTGQKLLIATVGLADPGISENRYHIRGALQRQLPKEAYERASIFHLRGAIDYQQLSLPHRAMMALLHRSLQGRPAEKWSEEDRALMETYGKKADFVDFGALEPILEEIKRL